MYSTGNPDALQDGGAVPDLSLPDRELRMTRYLVAAVLTAAIAVPGTALAIPHGRPGLWTVTTTMKMANMPDLPPQVLEMMKKRGMPGMGQPIVSQMCMTPNDVKEGADAARRMREQNNLNCTPRVISETSSSAVSEVTCHGMMEGVGRTTMAWHGDTAYEGDYSFKGAMHGQTTENSSHFVGKFVSADCGSVKPFSAKDIPAHAPPPPR